MTTASTLSQPFPGYNPDHLAAALGLPFGPRNTGWSVKMAGGVSRAVATPLLAAQR